ncbi:MAG TPA: cytochrome c oxidase assembly protein [Burkholderiales bacterium]|jgi:cytochrome c oxidase assembly protein subunit 11|nr:cytochrome c oxidase assembly protein [Burkholderiales bacterium]
MALVSAQRESRVTAAKLAVIAVLMFGFGFALIPFYKKICVAVGLYGPAQTQPVAANTQVDASRLVTVQFDTNLIPGLPWQFMPLQSQIKVHPGELVQVEFEVSNQSARAITGRAIPSYAPQLAALHVRKLQCFCFAQQTLAPGERRRMPVVFVLDPSLPAAVEYVALSYTFFEVPESQREPV